jgi:predicted transporter
MELKSLFLGLTFTIGIFALKSGVGIHYLFTQKSDLKDKILFISGSALIYFLIFSISYLILKKINMIDYYNTFQMLFRSGMYIHFFMASGLIVWGIYLLKSQGERQKGSKAFWALIIPCPICTTVVFLTTAFLMAYFPHIGLFAVMGAYLFFMLINFVTILSLTLWDIRADVTPEHTLGTAMLFIAIYFILSIIIMPQFSDIDKIYRIAAYRGEEASMNIRDILFLLATMATFFITGYLIKRRKIRRERNWI